MKGLVNLMGAMGIKLSSSTVNHYSTLSCERVRAHTGREMSAHKNLERTEIFL